MDFGPTRTLSKNEKKKVYFKRLAYYCETYPQVLIVQADNVGSKQMADIRKALRGKALLLMGKNTMMRTALRQQLEKNPELEKLIECVKLNIGMVFCMDDMGEVRKIISEKRVPAPARAGAIAPIDVDVPAGPTSLGPEHTSFFQALGIGTKISKGMVEINQETRVINKGEKVGASQAALLQKLNIRPFSYGLVVERVYDAGDVYEADVLDMSDDVLLTTFMNGVKNVAALSKELGVPTEASLVHSLIEAFKNCASLGLETDCIFPEMQDIKKYLDDPSAFAGAGGGGGGGAAVSGGGGGGGGGAAAAPAKEEPEEEEEDMGMGLFGD